MEKQASYNSLSEILTSFEKVACNYINSEKYPSEKIPYNTCAGAIFYLYIAEMAEPEKFNVINRRDEKARGFITGIKKYIKQIDNNSLEKKILKKIVDTTASQPQALSYGISHKTNPYVKGIIRATCDLLNNATNLEDIGKTLKSTKTTQNMLKQKEYWSIYYALERLLNDTTRKH